MSDAEWVVGAPAMDGRGQGRPYILVPELHLVPNIGLGRLSIAGWSDTGGAYPCPGCKKQVHLSLKELRIFPLVKPDTDKFQFSCMVAPHKVGGAFSSEVCKESGATVLREYEYPTSVRFGAEDLPSAEAVSGGDAPGGPVPTEPEAAEVKAKVAALSPEEAESRYEYLVSRPIGDLTDAEYSERLALAERLAAKGGRNR